MKSIGSALLLALLASSQQASAKTDTTLSARQSQLIDRFVEVCMKGSGKFASTEISTIGYGELPGMIRSWYRGAKGPASYALVGSEPGYLLMFENPQARGTQYVRGCALAVEDLPTCPAYFHVASQLEGYNLMQALDKLCEVPRRFMRPDYEQGYEFRANSLWNGRTKFTVLQVSFLNEADRRRRLASWTRELRRSKKYKEPGPQ